MAIAATRPYRDLGIESSPARFVRRIVFAAAQKR
jgi:hypothetical protein